MLNKRNAAARSAAQAERETEKDVQDKGTDTEEIPDTDHRYHFMT